VANNKFRVRDGLEVVGDTLITGTATINSLIFNDTTISTPTNFNILLNPNGTGVIELMADTNVTGALDVTGALTAGSFSSDSISVNNISSADSTAIQINDGVNVSGTLTANTFVTNNISSSESSAIQVDDAMNVSGAFTANSTVTFNAGYVERINALTAGTTITINCALAPVHKVTLTANTGFVITSLPTGGSVTVIIVQDGTGSRTATFGTDTSTAVKFAGGTPTLSTAASSIDIVTIFNDGTNYYGDIGKAYA